MKPPITFEDYQALVKALVERDKQIERLTAELTQVQNADGAVIKCLNDRMAALEAENAKLKEEKTECNEGNLSKQD